jgi:two-component system NarL family sensor kinase
MKHPVNIGKSQANIAPATLIWAISGRRYNTTSRQPASSTNSGMNEFLPRLYISIGSAFEHANLFNKSVVYKQKALQLARPMKDSLQLADILTNIGGSISISKNTTKPWRISSEGLVVAENIHSDIFIIQVMQDFADEPPSEKPRKSKGLRDRKGLILQEKSGNVFLEMECLRALMFFAEDNNQTDLSAKYTKEALTIAEANNMTDHLVELYEDYATDLARQHNYKAAYDYLMKYSILNDSIQGIDIQKQLQELDTKYLTAQKENQIVKLEKEKQTRNTLIYGS